MTVAASDVIAGLAFAGAVFAIIQTAKFNRRQIAFGETTDRLNQLLISKDAVEKAAADRAVVSASYLKSGVNSYKVRVFNKGQGAASNLRLEVLEGGDVLIESDIESKFPWPLLEQHQNVDLIAAPSFGSSQRIVVRLTWDDATGMDQHKDVVMSL